MRKRGQSGEVLSMWSARSGADVRSTAADAVLVHRNADGGLDTLTLEEDAAIRQCKTPGDNTKLDPFRQQELTRNLSSIFFNNL